MLVLLFSLVYGLSLFQHVLGLFYATGPSWISSGKHSSTVLPPSGQCLYWIVPFDAGLLRQWRHWHLQQCSSKVSKQFGFGMLNIDCNLQFTIRRYLKLKFLMPWFQTSLVKTRRIKLLSRFWRQLRRRASKKAQLLRIDLLIDNIIYLHNYTVKSMGKLTFHSVPFLSIYYLFHNHCTVSD